MNALDTRYCWHAWKYGSSSVGCVVNCGKPRPPLEAQTPTDDYKPPIQKWTDPKEIESMRAQLDAARKVMRWLDQKGGLGSDTHTMIREATPLPRPPYPRFCHSFEECALAGRCRRDPCCID